MSARRSSKRIVIHFDADLYSVIHLKAAHTHRAISSVVKDLATFER
jgi:hypothetical protein